MTDHYELLGVEPDASKDEIKAAYRAEVADADSSRRAQLNRAWNVLSDPVQRERYDEQRTAETGDARGAEVAVVGAKSRATGARRGPAGTTVETNVTTAATIGKRVCRVTADLPFWRRRFVPCRSSVRTVWVSGIYRLACHYAFP